MFIEMLNEASLVPEPYSGKILKVAEDMTSCFPNPYHYNEIYLNTVLKKPYGALVYRKKNGYVGCILFDRGVDDYGKTKYGFIMYQLKANGILEPRKIVFGAEPKEYKAKFPTEKDALKFIHEAQKKLVGKKIDDDLESIVQKIFEKY